MLTYKIFLFKGFNKFKILKLEFLIKFKIFLSLKIFIGLFCHYLLMNLRRWHSKVSEIPNNITLNISIKSYKWAEYKLRMVKPILNSLYISSIISPIFQTKVLKWVIQWLKIYFKRFKTKILQTNRNLSMTWIKLK